MKQDLQDLGQPSAERLQRLPVWAQEWINTLVFEVRWLRDQAESTSQSTKKQRQRSLF